MAIIRPGPLGYNGPSMWQSLLRNWILGQAQQQVRAAAMQAAAEAAAKAQPADPLRPPERKRDVCHVGLVFALPIEAGGLVDRLSGAIRIEGSGFVAREGGLDGRRLVIVESGVGCAAARRATETLIAGHRPQWVISAGFAGGLHASVAQGDILLPDEIVDANERKLAIDFKVERETIATQRHLHVGRLLTADRIIHDPAEKEALGRRFGALAVDMESIAVAEVCRSEKVRFLAVRVISDTVGRELPKDIDFLVKRRTRAGRLGAAAGAILRRPSSIKDMWQLKEDALVASQRLAGFLAGIVGQLPREERMKEERMKEERMKDEG
jgi:adenosylhomocysteine nucleosidase